MLTGELLPGFRREAVTAEVADQLGVSAGSLEHVFDGGEYSVGQLFAAAEEASALQRRLELLGARSRVEAVRAVGERAAGLPGGLASPTDSDPGDAGLTRCPACGHRQPAASRCAACGLVFTDYRRDRAARQRELDLVDVAAAAAPPPPAPARPAQRHWQTPPRDIHAATRAEWHRDWLDEEDQQPTEQHHVQLFMGMDSAHLSDACERMMFGWRTRPTLSWTGGAVFSPFLWAMYRKMYAWGAVIFLFEILLPVALLTLGSKYGVPGILLYLGAALLVANRVFWPAVLKFLYCRHARRTIMYLNRMSPTFAADIDIATTGGTSRTSVFLGLVIAMVLSLLTWSIIDSAYATLIEPNLTFSPTAGLPPPADVDQLQHDGSAETALDQRLVNENRWVATRTRLRRLSLQIDNWLDSGGRDVNPARLTMAEIASALSLGRDSTRDAWGRPFSFRSDGRVYKLISAGPDGEYGSADDIEYRRQRKH